MADLTIRPIKALSKGAEIIGKGNLDYRIEIKSRDELGQLAREFNQMTAQIKEAKAEGDRSPASWKNRSRWPRRSRRV